MNTAINFESQSEFRFVLNIVKQIIAASKPSDNQAIMSHIYIRRHQQIWISIILTK